MKSVRRFPALLVAGGMLFVFGLSTIRSASAADAGQEKPARVYNVLMITQSAGYQHSSVTRHADKLSFAEETVTKLGLSSGLFKVECTQAAPRRHDPRASSPTPTSCSSTPPAI